MELVREKISDNAIDLLTQRREYVGVVNDRHNDGVWRFNASMRLLDEDTLLAVAGELKKLNAAT